MFNSFQYIATMPEKQQIAQNKRANGPDKEKYQHRIEVVTCAFLCFWITADILSVYGHNEIAVYAFYFALLFPLALLVHHARKGWPFWAKVGIWAFVLFFFIVPAFLWWVSYSASFSISTYAANPLSYTRERVSFMWCVHNGPDGKPEASPVYLPFYFQFINERDTPMFIDNFYVERCSPSGEWEMMPVIETHPQYAKPVDFYFLNFNMGTSFTWTNFLQSFKNAHRFILIDDLQSKLSEKAVGPNETVSGWLMMDIPTNGWTGKWRFTISTGGETITRPIKEFVQPKYPGIRLHNPTPAYETMDYRDISGLPLRFYSDNEPCGAPGQIP